MTDLEVIELLHAFTRATAAPWLLGIDRMKQPIVTDGDGRVIVEADTYADDIRLIVLLHRHVKPLLDALTKAREETKAARIVMEREVGRLLVEADMARAHLQIQLDEAQRNLTEATKQLDAAKNDRARLVAIEAERHRMAPLVDAVINWRRTHYSPGLQAAVDRYKEEISS